MNKEYIEDYREKKYYADERDRSAMELHGYSKDLNEIIRDKDDTIRAKDTSIQVLTDEVDLLKMEVDFLKNSLSYRLAHNRFIRLLGFPVILFRKIKNRNIIVNEQLDEQLEIEEVQKQSTTEDDVDKAYIECDLGPKYTYNVEMRPFINVSVSFVIPTYNGASDIMRLINRIKRQICIREIEIIIVDSGSTDDTVKNAEYFDAKVIKIKHEEFSHSYARNLGAKEAKGDYILFMTQDAYPTDSMWLYRLVYSVKKSGAVAVSPAEDASQGDNIYSESNAYYFHKHAMGDLICTYPKGEDLDINDIRTCCQLTDVACLINKDIFLKYEYRGDYAEDLDLGIRLTKDGYKINRLCSTRVYHSHTRPADYYLKRSYIETKALHNMFSEINNIEAKNKEELMRFLSDSYSVTHLYISAIKKAEIKSVIDITNLLRKLMYERGSLDIEIEFEDTLLMKQVIDQLNISIVNKRFEEELNAYIYQILEPFLEGEFNEKRMSMDRLKQEVCECLYNRLATQFGSALYEYSKSYDDCNDLIKGFAEGI